VILLRQSAFAKATAEMGYGGRADGVWRILAASLQGKAVQLLRISGESRAAYQPSRDALWREGEHGQASEGSAAIFGTMNLFQTLEFWSDRFSNV